MSALDVINQALAEGSYIHFDYVGSDMSVKRGKVVAPIEIKDGYLYGRYEDAKDEKDIRRFLVAGIQEATVLPYSIVPINVPVKKLFQKKAILTDMRKFLTEIPDDTRITPVGEFPVPRKVIEWFLDKYEREQL